MPEGHGLEDQKAIGIFAGMEVLCIAGYAENPRQQQDLRLLGRAGIPQKCRSIEGATATSA